jgi:hypothetical protein
MSSTGLAGALMGRSAPMENRMIRKMQSGRRARARLMGGILVSMALAGCASPPLRDVTVRTGSGAAAAGDGEIPPPGVILRSADPAHAPSPPPAAAPPGPLREHALGEQAPAPATVRPRRYVHDPIFRPWGYPPYGWNGVGPRRGIHFGW